MKLIIRLLIVFVVAVSSLAAREVVPVNAQICYPSRVFNQHFCRNSGSSICNGWTDICNVSGTACGGLCPGIYCPCPGSCSTVCTSYSGGQSCQVESGLASCSGPPSCQANITIRSCQEQGTTCTESNQVLTYGCWGPGDPAPVCGDGSCNGTETCTSCPGDCGACTGSCGNGVCGGSETCSTCPADCGSCAFCGDGSCNGGETCSSCAGDCGSCATPVPTSAPPPTPTPPPPPPPPVPTINISASPTTVNSGGSSTISWTVTNADICVASQAWSGTKNNVSGSQSSGPLTSNSVFTLTCTGPGGQTQASTTVSVNGAPPPAPAPTVTLTASPTSVNSGDSTTLTWTTSNATSCTASGSWTGIKATNGNQTITNITSDRNYILNCTGAGGSSSDTATVTVNLVTPPPYVYLVASPSIVNNGGSTTLTWTVQDATSCNASGGWSGAKSASGTNSQQITNLTVDTTFNLQCTGPGGTSNSSAAITIGSTCGDGACDFTIGESCSACFADCSAYCSALPVCGDGVCDIGEICPADCGAGPVDCIANPAPNPVDILVGNTAVVNANLTGTECTFPQVNFVTTDATRVTATSPDTSSPFSTTVTGVSQGIVNVNIFGEQGGLLADLGSFQVNVTENVCTIPAPIDPPTVTCAPDPSSTGSIVWRWNAVPGADEYVVRIRRTSGGVADSSGGWQSDVTYGCAGGGVCEFTSAALSPGSYYSEIRARGICSQSAIGTSAIQDLGTCGYSVGGIGVILDEGGNYTIDGNNRCQPTGPTTGVQPGSSASCPTCTDSVVQDTTGTYQSIVNPGGTYTDLQLPGSATAYGVELVIGDPASYTCTCPNVNCQYSVSVGPDDGDVNFFVTAQKDPWFQLIGGDMHVNNSTNEPQAYINPVPFTCKLDQDTGGNCQPYNIARANNAISGTSGILTYGSGAVDTWGQAGDQINRVSADDVDTDSDGEPDVARAAQTQIGLPGQNYDYFYRLQEFGLNPGADDDFDGGPGESLGSDAQLPNNQPANNKPAYYHSGDMTINSDWNVGLTDGIDVDGGGPDGVVIVFIDGNLDFNASVTSPVGTFVAFIVSGNVTFDANLGDADPTDGIDTIFEGVIIADGTITIESLGGTNNDLAANFAGTLVGWNGFAIERDYRSNFNNNNPIVTFEYRPDFLLNAPPTFRTSQFRWRQEAP